MRKRRVGARASGRGCLTLGLHGGNRARLPVIARHVVDLHAGLHVVDEDVEAYGLPAVFHGFRLHLNPARHQVVRCKERGHAIEDMVVRAADVVAHQLLVIGHPHGVHRARAGDEVTLVGVLAAQLVRNEVAAIVEHLVVDEAVAMLDPARRVDLRDVAAFGIGDGFGSDKACRRPAAPLEVELAEIEERSARRVIGGESRLSLVDIDAERARVFGNIG